MKTFGWRMLLPEAGMSSVAVSGNRVFTTTHVSIEKLEEKKWVTDIIGFCLKADAGEILWQVTLPGNAGISLAGGIFHRRVRLDFGFSFLC